MAHFLLPTYESDRVEFKTSFNEDVIVTLVAFSNTKGGVVYIGVSDNGEVKGTQFGRETFAGWINEIKNKTAPAIIPDMEDITIDGKVVLLMRVIEYPIKPVSTRGRYYKRVGNANHIIPIAEVANLHLKTVNSSWDFYLMEGKLLNDISLEKVQKLIDTINRRKKDTIADDPLTFLRKYQLISDEKITHACWLLFLPDRDVCTTVELGHFASSTLIKDSLTLNSDLFSEADDIMDFIRKHINKQVIIKGQLENEERWDYPLEALRELVLNMIVHRDYTSSYDSVLKIFDNYIEFYNPGAAPADINLQHLLTNDYVSQPRNKLIAEVFKASGLIEKYGSGIKRVLEAFNAYGLLQPEFQLLKDGFRVKVFSASYSAVIDMVNDSVVDNVVDNVVDKRLDKILKLIGDNREISASQIAGLMNVSGRTVQREIEKLKKLKKLKRMGPENGGYWELIN